MGSKHFPQCMAFPNLGWPGYYFSAWMGVFTLICGLLHMLFKQLPWRLFGLSGKAFGLSRHKVWSPEPATGRRPREYRVAVDHTPDPPSKN